MPRTSSETSLNPPRSLGEEAITSVFHRCRSAKTPVHLEQIARPQRGLLTPGAAADLDDHVLALVGILRDEEVLELRAQLLGPGVEPFDLLGEVGGHLRVALGRHDARLLGLREHRPQLPIRRHDHLELRIPLPERPQQVRIRDRLRGRQLRRDLVIRSLDPIQPLTDPRAIALRFSQRGRARRDHLD